MFDLTGSGAEPLRPDDPAHIGGIRLAGRLGTGGMGRVFLGVHEGRYVAVKQVLPSVAGEDRDFVRRFGHELDNLSRLPPEATAPLLASDRDARPPWLATAYVPGLTLSDAVRLHQGPLPAEAVWLLLREAAAGLVPVHGLGMVHRDLKPSNVMLTVEGATVIDFGVARATEQSQLTRSGVVVGTPAYMAPEQAVTRRDLTGAVDVFALGSVIAYAAGGNPPFGEESGPAVLYRIVHEEPDLEAVRELDPALADLVTACLVKNPEARPTAAELLRRATEHGPSTAPLWPDSFSADLAAKAAFAAHVQEPGPPPHVSVETLNLGRKSGPKPPAERRRRTRVLLAVVPVVIAGGATLAVQLLPHISDADDPTGTTPSLSASAPTTPGTGRPARPPPQHPPRTRRRRRTRRKMRTGTRKTRTPTRAQARGTTRRTEPMPPAPGTRATVPAPPAAPVPPAAVAAPPRPKTPTGTPSPRPAPTATATARTPNAWPPRSTAHPPPPPATAPARSGPSAPSRTALSRSSTSRAAPASPPAPEAPCSSPATRTTAAAGAPAPAAPSRA